MLSALSALLTIKSIRDIMSILYEKSVLKCVVEVKPPPSQPFDWVNVTWFSTLQ